MHGKAICDNDKPLNYKLFLGKIIYKPAPLCGKDLTLESDYETLKTFPVARQVQAVAYTIDVSADGFLLHLQHLAHAIQGISHAL